MRETDLSLFRRPPLDDEPLPRKTIHRPSRSDPDSLREATIKKLDQHITELVDKYKTRFGFLNKNESPMKPWDIDGGMGGAVGSVHGITFPLTLGKSEDHPSLKKVGIWICLDKLEGLFHHKPQILPEHETFGVQFSVAQTIAHEGMFSFCLFRLPIELFNIADCKVIHALFLSFREEIGDPIWKEEYYHLECIPVPEVCLLLLRSFFTGLESSSRPSAHNSLISLLPSLDLLSWFKILTRCSFTAWT